jgi:nitroreductase
MDASLSGKAAHLPYFDRPLDRRQFLLVAGGGIAGLALGPALAWARHRPVGPALQPWSLPEDPPGNPVDLARALIGAAILAPNHWNSQPWLFEVEGSSIRLVADTRRSLPAIDPDQRLMMMSLGAALENLLVAARSYGLRPKVVYVPHAGAGSVVAEVSWTGGDVRRDRALFHAITERRTNRRDYDGRGIFPHNRVQLLAQAPEGFHLHWLDDRKAIHDIADLAHGAVEARWRDPRSQAERYAWMRFGDDDARRGDGVPVDALEFNGPAKWMARRYFNPRSWLRGLGAESAAKQMRSATRSSGALVLLTTARGGEQPWVVAGQAYERFALEATQLGIAHQPINEPLAWERSRPAILKRFDAAGEEPLMLVRLGHAKRPGASARRAVALVASFRNS